MFEMKDICEKEASNVIINGIEKLHSIQEPRIDLEQENWNNFPCMEIMLLISRPKNCETCTQIVISNGNYYHQVSMDDSYYFSGIISNVSLSILIDYLLENFPIITNLYTCKNILSLGFTFDLTDSNKRGLNCKKVSLSIKSQNNEIDYIIDDYLRFVFEKYYYQLQKTSYFQEMFEQCFYALKRDIIKKMTKNEILNFFKKVSKKELQDFLLQMNNVEFFERHFEGLKVEPKKLMLKKMFDNKK